MRKTLHTMHRGSLRCVVIEFYKQQSVFNHVCSFGTSGQQQHHRPTRKAGSQLWGWTHWMHLASTSLVQQDCHRVFALTTGPSSVVVQFILDSSINTCCRRNAHSFRTLLSSSLVESGAHSPLHIPCAPRACEQK